MRPVNAAKLHRKSGGAQPRDLRFSEPFLGMFFDRACHGSLADPQGDKKLLPFSNRSPWSVALPFVIPIRISCHAALDTAACAPFR